MTKTNKFQARRCWGGAGFLQNNKIFSAKDFNLQPSSSLFSFEQTRRKNLSKSRDKNKEKKN